MRALELADPVTQPATIEDVPEPAPLDDEVLVRVHATAVTPSELIWSPTTHTKDGAARTRAIPSHEFSGVVEAVGDDVRGVRVGDKVFGMNDWFADGAMAELVITRKEWIAAKPEAVAADQKKAAE